MQAKDYFLKAVHSIARPGCIGVVVNVSDIAACGGWLKIIWFSAQTVVEEQGECYFDAREEILYAISVNEAREVLRVLN